MQDELLIVGIDPGVTAAYAALNIKGAIVKLKSEKYLSLNTVVNELTKEGRIIAVGTDVKYSPKFVDKFCSRLSAKLISPKEDMKIGYKQRLTENFRYHDDHQRDALAGAIFAYREIKPLLQKINFMLKREGKEHLAHEMTLLVIKGMPIADALHHLEEKKEEIKAKKRIRKKIKKSSAFIEFNHLLKKENDELKQEIHYLKRKIENISQSMESLLHEKIQKTLDIKEKKITESNTFIEKQKKEIDILKRKIMELNEVLFSTKNKLVIKHLRTLGWNEVERTIEQNDQVILVDDINIFSEKALEFIKDKISTIIFKLHPSKALEQQSFNFINAKHLQVEEYENFAVVNKGDLEREKEKSNLLSKIVQEYQEERHAQL